MQNLWRIFSRSAVWEWRKVARSPLEQVTLLWLPAIAIGSIWFIFSTSQVRDLPVGILDKDNTALSRKLVSMVDASPNVSVTVRHRNAQEMQGDLKKTKVYATLIIPKDFSRHVRQLQPSPVTLVVNAQYGTHSGVIQSGVGGAVRAFSASLELHMRKKMGLRHEQALNALIPIKANTKMAFNLSLNYQQYLAGTIIPALLHILATVVGVSVAGRELRDKSLGKWFWGVSGGNITRPSRFWVLFIALLGKLFWYSLAFCGWITLTLLLVAWAEHPPLNNLGITVITACLLMILSLWLGVILTMLTMSKRKGLSNAGMITGPAFAFSGITYPLMAMPELAQKIAMVLPLTHYLQLQVAQIQIRQPWQSGLSTVYGFSFTVMVMIILATWLTLLALKRKHRWGMR